MDLEKHLDQILNSMDDVKATQSEHGEALARILQQIYPREDGALTRCAENEDDIRENKKGQEGQEERIDDLEKFHWKALTIIGVVMFVMESAERLGFFTYLMNIVK